MDSRLLEDEDYRVYQYNCNDYLSEFTFDNTAAA